VCQKDVGLGLCVELKLQSPLGSMQMIGKF